MLAQIYVNHLAGLTTAAPCAQKQGSLVRRPALPRHPTHIHAHRTSRQVTTAAAAATAPIPLLRKIPKSLSEIDNGKILGFGADLAVDHPGFGDEAYKQRRVSISELARDHQIGSKNSLAAVPHSAAGMRLAQVCSRLQQEGMPAEEVTVATPAPAGWYQYFQETLSASGVQFQGAYEWVLRTAKPKLYFKEHSLMSELLKLCPVLHQDYAPPLVSLNGSMHMILSVVVRRAYVTSKYTRHCLTTPDGGTISLDWWHASHQSKLSATTPVLLCLHAFAGDSNESYMLFMCKEAKKMGWRSVAMNYRGCGDTPLTSPKPMHIGLSADVYEAVHYIRQQFPHAPVFLVGFSIGAYTMTKYVGEADSGVWPKDGKVQGAVLIGSGYDYAAEIAKISRPAILRLLNFHCINCTWWRGYCSKHKQELRKDPRINLQAVKTASWTSETEAALICPAWGYADIEAYYSDINGLKWIPHIKTPTLFLSAMDDPFLGEGSPPRPYKECSSNPFTVFVLTAHGGHCAHLPLGSWLTGKAWMDTVAMQFFSAVLKQSSEHSSSHAAAGTNAHREDETSDHSQGDASAG